VKSDIVTFEEGAMDNFLEPDSPSRIMRWTERFPIFGHNPILSLACTLALVATAWLLRLATNVSLPPGYPYITFFPAVIVTSFMFGVRMGALSATLCGLIAWYYFIAPANSFSTEGVKVALGFYVFVVTTDLLLVQGMQAANKQLQKEREISLVLAKAKAQTVIELEQQIAGKRIAIARLEESDLITHLATQTSGIGLWKWNISSDRIDWDSEMFEIYGISKTVDGSLKYSDFIKSVHPDDAANQDAVLQDTVNRCGTSSREFRIRRADDGRIRYIRAVEAARAGLDGQAQWVVGTNLDITEQKNRDSHVQLLIGEINHRANNLLAVVMSVVNQTGGVTNREFVKTLSERIRSLAASQNILVESEWKSVELKNLILAQLNHFRDLIGSRITIEGDTVHMSPAAVQTIGMAIHELATNSSKYGALSDGFGRIAIAWHISRNAASERFVMNWSEFDGPLVVHSKRKGFGSKVTGEVVEMNLGAEVTSDFATTGFSWKLICPMKNVIE
jgi:two-component sensor histidine kinase